MSLLQKTVGANPKDVLKLETPYGLQLRWKLKHGMPFILHLKDKIKVSCVTLLLTLHNLCKCSEIIQNILIRIDTALV